MLGLWSLWHRIAHIVRFRSQDKRLIAITTLHRTGLGTDLQGVYRGQSATARAKGRAFTAVKSHCQGRLGKKCRHFVCRCFDAQKMRSNESN